METATLPQAPASPEVPAELRRWNWAAFSLNWIWAVAHRCYFGLLVFVPFFGLVVPFVLGAKGNRWAWQAGKNAGNQVGKYASIGEFMASQRRWARAALIAYASAIVFAVGMIFLASAGLERTAAFQLARSQLSRDPRVEQALGTPLSLGFVSGSVQKGAASGHTELAFSVSGPKNSGRAYVECSQHAAMWTLDQLSVVLESGQRLVLTDSSTTSTSSALSDATPRAEALPTLPVLPEPAQAPRAVNLNLQGLTVRGKLSDTQARVAIERQISTVSACLASVDSPSPLSAKLVIAPSGDVQTASVRRAATVSQDLRECVTRALGAFRFPAPTDAGQVTLTLTLAEHGRASR